MDIHTDLAARSVGRLKKVRAQDVDCHRERDVRFMDNYWSVKISRRTGYYWENINVLTTHSDERHECIC